MCDCFPISAQKVVVKGVNRLSRRIFLGNSGTLYLIPSQSRAVGTPLLRASFKAVLNPGSIGEEYSVRVRFMSSSKSRDASARWDAQKSVEKTANDTPKKTRKGRGGETGVIGGGEQTEERRACCVAAFSTAILTWFLTLSMMYLATFSPTNPSTNSATDLSSNSTANSMTNLPTYVPTYSAMNSPTYLLTYSSTYFSTYSATYSTANSTTNLVTYFLTYFSTNQPTYPSTNSMTYSTTNLPTNLSEYLFTYPPPDDPPGWKSTGVCPFSRLRHMYA